MIALAPELILASRSPRRVKLLREAGFAFSALPANIDETAYEPDLAATPARVAEFLARGKADVIARRHPIAVVLGADTIVVAGSALLGQPTDADHARWMLEQLTGAPHQVVTGVCVMRIDPPHLVLTHAISTVAMRPLEPAEMDAYIATGDWRGKAGGYGIQDRDTVVTRIDGSLSNIVGLPMELVVPLLADAGVLPSSAARPRNPQAAR